MLSSKEMLELTDYIYNNFSNIRKMFPKWRLLSFLDKFDYRITYEKNDRGFNGAAVFLKLPDDILARVISKDLDIADPSDMNLLLRSEGDNLHFLFVTAKNTKTILKGLRKTIDRENPSTVSWFDINRNFRMIKFRRKVWLQS